MSNTLSIIRRNMENLLYKSAVDKEFRSRCLKEGKTVLEEELGKKLDEDIKVRFVENINKKEEVELRGKDLLFVLPDYVGTLNKLNRGDLEKITGGVSDFMQKNDSAINNLISFMI